MDHATPARFLAAHEATATAPASACCCRPRAAARPMRGPAAPAAAAAPRRLAHERHHPGQRRGRSTCPPPWPPWPPKPTWPASPCRPTASRSSCWPTTAPMPRPPWCASRPGSFRTWCVHVAELCLPPAEAHVGRARRLLMDEACARLEQVGQPGRHHCQHRCRYPRGARPGWPPSGRNSGRGRCRGRPHSHRSRTGRRRLPRRCSACRRAMRPTACSAPGSKHLLDPAPADPWPRHHQHFGASLALTARAYRRVGGLPEVRFLEDEALCQPLRRHDLALRHSPRVQVLTSARQRGAGGSGPVVAAARVAAHEPAAARAPRRKPRAAGCGGGSCAASCAPVGRPPGRRAAPLVLRWACPPPRCWHGCSRRLRLVSSGNGHWRTAPTWRMALVPLSRGAAACCRSLFAHSAASAVAGREAGTWLLRKLHRNKFFASVFPTSRAGTFVPLAGKVAHGASAPVLARKNSCTSSPVSG